MSKANPEIEVKLAYYARRDWEKYLKLREDKESLHSTWKEWHEEFLKAKRNLTKQGLPVKKCKVNLDELARYCFERNIKIDGKACSEFVARK